MPARSVRKKMALCAVIPQGPRGCGSPSLGRSGVSGKYISKRASSTTPGIAIADWGLLTPEAVHHGRAEELQSARQRVLDDACTRHPERFVNGPPRRRNTGRGVDQSASDPHRMPTTKTVNFHLKCLIVIDTSHSILARRDTGRRFSCRATKNRGLGRLEDRAKLTSSENGGVRDFY